MTVSNIHDSNAMLIVSNGRLVSLLMQLIKLVVHKIPHQVGIPASYAREKRRKSMYPLDRIHGGGVTNHPPISFNNIGDDHNGGKSISDVAIWSQKPNISRRWSSWLACELCCH